MPDPVDPHLQQLRAKAEKRLQELGRSNGLTGERDEILEELRIYQAELEIQNQHLRDTQEQLQHSFDRFNCLYHQSPVGYITIDRQGQIHDVNESFAAMLGYPPDRLLLQYLAEYCSPESADVLRQRLPSFYRQPEDKVLDLALTTTGKQTLLVEIQGRPLPGKPHLACNVIDRTQRILAEEDSRDARAQLQAITAAARNPIIMINSRGLVTYSNPACFRVFGYEPQELIGQDLHKLLAPEHHLAAFHRNIDEFRRSGTGQAIGKTIELQARHKKGQLISIELSLSRVAIKGEWHGVGIIQDITESKKKEQEARLNNERLGHMHHLMQYIIHHDPNAIAVLDRNLYFLFVSDRFLQDYRVTRKEIIGKHHYEVFPDIPETWRNVHQRALGGEVLGSQEDAFAREDGQIDYTRWHCRPWYDIDGTIGGIILYTEVITERKQMELALSNRTKELEQRTAELERFNYTVSHDLKSPLVTINTFLGFLEQDMHSGDTAKISEDMQHMHTAAERMGILLDDLLSLSRLGWVADQPETLSLHALLEHTLKMLQGQIQESGAQISLPVSDLQLYADPSQLLEVWQNLIDNAMKYAVGQDTIHINIGFECASDTIFYVCDNGPGIAAEYHQKIFRLFEKLDRHSQGSGLGLALVKRVIEKHGGKIWVESAGNGQGCCFKFTLPNATGPLEGKTANSPGFLTES